MSSNGFRLSELEEKLKALEQRVHALENPDEGVLFSFPDDTVKRALELIWSNKGQGIKYRASKDMCLKIMTSSVAQCEELFQAEKLPYKILAE